MTHQVYDRQAGESTKSFSGFVAYRDLGVQRSLEMAWKQYSKGDKRVPGYFKQWSSDYNWVSRAAVYDDYVDAQARKKFEADAIKRKADMLRRHALSGKVLQQKGIDYLSQHGVDKSTDAIAAVRVGVEMERKSEGLPEYLMAVVEASDDELQRQYNALLEEIGRASSGNDTAGNGDSQTRTAVADESA